MFTACVEIPHQALAKHARTSVRRIVLLRTAEPANMRVTNMGGISGAFGLIGAAIESADEDAKSAEFTASMIAQNVRIGEELSVRLEAALRKQGYDVKLWATKSPRPPDHDPADYSQPDYSKLAGFEQAAEEADAILDVWLSNVGYLALGKDYVPWIRANARLVSIKDLSQIYFQAFSYGAEIAADGVEHFPADTQFAYGDFQALLANSGNAAAGLQAGVEPLAERIATDLR
jgi:hypothetical protein